MNEPGNILLQALLINNPAGPELLDTKAVAQLLGVPAIKLCRWRKQGGGPRWFHINTWHIRYHPDDVAAWLADHPITKKPKPAVRLIDKDWCVGFQAGLIGQAGTPPPKCDELSFLAGWLEGDTKRTQIARTGTA